VTQTSLPSTRPVIIDHTGMVDRFINKSDFAASSSELSVRGHAFSVRWTAILLWVLAFILGTEGGWMVMVCMGLTVAGVVLWMITGLMLADDASE